jgi:hypothetical protein
MSLLKDLNFIYHKVFFYISKENKKHYSTLQVDDRGEFIIHAENHYGVTEEPVFLNVQPVPKDLPRYEPEPLPVRKREVSSYKLYKEEKESAPMFSFHLRPRYFIYDSIETFYLNSTDGKGEEDNLENVELFKLNGGSLLPI